MVDTGLDIQSRHRRYMGGGYGGIPFITVPPQSHAPLMCADPKLIYVLQHLSTPLVFLKQGCVR